MKKQVLAIMVLGLLAGCSSSDDEETKDMTYPTISEEGITASPIDCQVYHRGEVIPFNYVFTDNRELGAYNIEIHSNFDHHTHGTSSAECTWEDEDHDHEHEEQHVKPWVYNQDFSIPQGLTTYNARIDIAIPADIDAGDYHFMVRLTDRAGWQQLKAMAIRIEE